MHRGWHQIDPILRGILGILASLTILPALIVELKSKNGFAQTFFAKPDTNTSQQITSFKTNYGAQKSKIDEIMDNSVKPSTAKK
jgi:hypothetical protein